MLHPRVLNSPVTLQAYSEKLIPTYLRIGIPSSLGLVQAPRSGVMKSLNGFGGFDVSRVRKDDQLDPNCIFQNFAPEIQILGETRYLSIGQEVFGEVQKTPKEGEFRVNTYHGGKLSYREPQADRQRHAAGVAEVLKKDLSVNFAGIDYIGTRISEINITCPTAYFYLYCRLPDSERRRFDEAFERVLLTD
jgi:glutathione synthase/RimK-type ligase-like ATP-grasp enzyme